MILTSNDNGADCQDEEQNAQANRDPEQRLFDPTASRKNSTGIHTGQAPQTGAFALYDYARNQGN